MKKFFKFIWFMTKLGLFFAVVGVVMIYALYKHYEPDLPSVEAIKEYRLQVPLRVFTEDGKLISVFGTKKRIPVSIDEIPLQVKQAYIAAEDSSFYSHPGFDIKGIMRAVWQIVTTGKKQGGGSTITQQLTRNVFLTLDQTWTRKIKELFLAVKLERTISKDEILELYLNKIALGHRSYGVAAAAEVYYGKTLDELTLAQSAMLAAPPKAPSRINPVTSPERALQRRDYVLGRMLDLDFITQQQHDQAVAEKDEAFVHEPVVEVSAPWVAEMVRTQMIEQYGDDAYTDGYDVITTIHSEKQLAAEAALQQGLHAYDRRHGYRGPIEQYDLSQIMVSEPAEAAAGLNEEAASSDEVQNLETITDALNGFPKPAGLQAALVLEVDAEHAVARLGDGQDVSLIFETSGWAVPHIDNYRVGNKPKDLTEILKVGDVVMVKRGETGEFELSQIPSVQGALVSMHPDDGSIYALVGGFDYYLSKFNRVTQAKRQPGSGFKPIIYSGALEHGLNASSIINDAPIVFEDDKLERTWRPENYSEKFFGPTRLREGIVHSRNLVSIRVLRHIGIRNGRNHILEFGFNPDDVPSDLSIALGSPNVPIIDMSRAFSVFANGGYLIEPHLIKSITNQAGETLYRYQGVQVCPGCDASAQVHTDESAETDSELETTDLSWTTPIDPDEPLPINAAPRVIPAENQFIIESFMQDAVKRGTGTKALVLERGDLAGKTGTTNDQIDGWFNGFQRNVVTNVWVGFDTPQPMGRGEVGGRVALPIWVDYMRVALADEPEYQRPVPAGLITAKVNRETGKLLKPSDKGGLLEYFKVGQLPAEDESKDDVDYDDLF